MWQRYLNQGQTTWLPIKSMLNITQINTVSEYYWKRNRIYFGFTFLPNFILNSWSYWYIVAVITNKRDIKYLAGWSLRSPQGDGDMNRGTGWYYINGEYCNFDIIPLFGKWEVFVEVKPAKSSLSNKLRLVDKDGGSYVAENDKNTHTPTAVTANRIQVFFLAMMTSSNGNIFRVTGHLCGEFTGPRWIPHTKASDAELWCFLWSTSE